MAVLTLVVQNNGETIFFDQAIPQVHFMKLISCSLYNLWLNLKTAASLSVVETNKGAKVSKLFSGHYNIETLAKKMEEALKKINYEIRADAYSPLGQIEMINLGNLPVAFDEDVADLLVIGERSLKAGGKLIIRQMKQPAYFVRVCLLVEGRGSRVTSRGSRVNGRGSRVTSRGSKNSSQLFLNVGKSKFRVYSSSVRVSVLFYINT